MMGWAIQLACQWMTCHHIRSTPHRAKTATTPKGRRILRDFHPRATPETTGKAFLDSDRKTHIFVGQVVRAREDARGGGCAEGLRPVIGCFFVDVMCRVE